MPAPNDAEIEARLTAFVQPAIFAELDYYRQLGKRNRMLNLPVMLALILGLIWRRVPGVCALQRLLARERILWAERKTVSQSALSDRFLDFPAVLIERVLYRVLARLPERFRARSRPTEALLSGVVALYQARWRIETTFLLVKRLLDLSYIWVGSQNGIWLQVLATFLFYAVLIDLCDDVAEALGVSLDEISIEMVCRGLYHYVTAVAQGDWSGDAPSYFAHEAKGLGILKRQRPRADPSLTDQIRWALVAPPLPNADLTL